MNRAPTDEERRKKALMRLALEVEVKNRTRFHTAQAEFLEKRETLALLYREAHELIRDWDELIAAYAAFLRGDRSEDLEQTQAFFQIRNGLLAISLKIQESLSLSALMTASGAEKEFGLIERPTLRRLLETPLPEQALAAMLNAFERGTLLARNAHVTETRNPLLASGAETTGT